MIDLTPLEVRKKKGDFRRAMRGYDPVLVDDFLDLVADRLEELVRENLTLIDRVSRQEQQVSDYRDRERALTEALVSAQEMREEVRRQATREAELAKKSAEQHAAQLRASVEEESRRLRAEAQEEVQRLRSTVQHQREREEEALRTLRARQEEFLTSYRSLLERELAELSVLSRTLGLTPGRGGDERAHHREPEPWGETAGREAERSAPPRRDAPPQAAPERAAPREAPKPEPPRAEAASAPAAPPPPVSQAPVVPPLTLPEEPTRSAYDEFTGDPLLAGDIDDEAAFALGDAPADIMELDAEPFEPEPFLPDEDAGFAGDDVRDAWNAEAASLETPAADATDVGGASEMKLYDAVAPDDDGDGVPGPIGLGSPFDDVDDDDPDTAALLRNAAAAGYQLADDALDEELLLDEPAPDDDEDAPPDDGWVGSLLDDDK